MPCGTSPRASRRCTRSALSTATSRRGNGLCCNAGNEEMFKLSDFGIARPVGVDVTFGRIVVGTPGYMSPEQISESSASVRSDVFSLACLSYFLLTAEGYIPANNAMEMLTLTARSRRPKLMHAPALCPELRDDPATCSLLDDWFGASHSARSVVAPQLRAALCRGGRTAFGRGQRSRLGALSVGAEHATLGFIAEYDLGRAPRTR